MISHDSRLSRFPSPRADEAMDRYREWLQKHAAMSGPLEIGLSLLACYSASRWEDEMSIFAEASYAAVGLITLLNESVLTSERATTQRGERLVLSALSQVGKASCFPPAE